jgi:phosphoglycerate kinase
MQKISDIQQIKNSRVLVRVSFDLPNLKDTTRILDAIPTIKLLLKNKNKLILCTKWGKVKEQDLQNPLESNLSLKKMQETLDIVFKKNLEEVYDLEFVNQFENFEILENKIKDRNLDSRDQIFLLENTHFEPKEKSKNPKERLEIAKKYAKLADFFVDEAFPSSHRSEATNTEIKELLTNCLGLSYQNELKNLNKLKEDIQKPYLVVMAGSKLETKLPLIQKILPKADKILLGGMLAFSFIKVAKDNNLPLFLGDKNKQYPELFDSQIEENFLQTALELLQKYPEKLVLPVDFVYDNKGDKRFAYDVGPKTLQLFENYLKTAKTIFWNGTLGFYEQKPFDKGTLELAEFVSNLEDTFSAIGGGDTNSSLPKHILEKFSFVSMGGGATLEYLSL